MRNSTSHSWPPRGAVLGIAHVVSRRHGRFWGVWVLHVLLGVAAFLAGLGRYFYRANG